MTTELDPKAVSSMVPTGTVKVTPDTVLLCFGGILMLGCLLIPWLGSGSLSLSGLMLAHSGFNYLFGLPLLGAIAIWQQVKYPRRRPLTVLMLGVAGILIVALFVSVVFNTDTAALTLRHNDALGAHLRFQSQDLEANFNKLSHIGVGFAVALLGPMVVLFSALARPKHLHPKALKSDCNMAQPDSRINSLEDIRPLWRLKNEYIYSLTWLVSFLLLIITYVWCDISPMKLWENRGNAREYLFGRGLNEADVAYIQDQINRAASIEAQGRARAYQDTKYRGIPFAEQPTLEEKFKENERLTAQFLSEMTHGQKKELADKARRNALDEKRGGYFPPETAWPKLKGYLVALLETVSIAIWGTLLAIVCAVPVSLFAARNTLMLIISGEGRIARAMRSFCIFGVRRFLDACRGFNEFVMALIFVAVIGLGPYAGILALWIHTFGILGKVFSEQIEAIEGGQIEALSSTGGAVSQVISFSVLPQVMPGFVSYALLRFESNVRSAAILGFVGAGGIGFLIFDKLNGYLFREVCSMMIIIIIAVGIIDFFCGKLRNRFI
ncbi:MAG: phosphonate ABC transporter, permease protein PhnE [Desulfobacteraceae bacterium]|jgi:phosphonate transport system permease protein